MHKRFLYITIILAMLFGAFGMMAPGGVQTAQAVAGWNDNRSLVSNTSLPYYESLDLSGANASADGDFGGCTLAPAFGAYQTHLLVPASEIDDFLRVRLEATDGNIQESAWAVRISNATAGGYRELGCALAPASGIVDLVVGVPASTDVLITVASHGVFVPTADLFDSWIVRGDNPRGGLIIDMSDDSGDMEDRRVEATNQADEGTDKFYIGETFNFGMYTFLDVPVGTYNIGVQDQTENAEFAAYYPDVDVPELGFILMTPDDDSLIPLEVLVRDMSDESFNVDNVVVTPNYFGLNSDLEVGPTNVGTEVEGQKTFRMNFNPPTYDYKWDIGVLFESTSEIIFFYEKDFNPVAGTLIFWGTAKVPGRVDLCADDGYDAGGLTLNPDSQLEPRDFAFIPGNSANCDTGYAGKSIFLSSNKFGPKPYEVSDLFLNEEGWTYYYELLGGMTWNLAPEDLLTGDPSAAFIIGDVPFITTPMPNGTSQEEYLMPLAAGEVALKRGPWTDQDLNKLVMIFDETGEEAEEIFPEYWLMTANPHPSDYEPRIELLANDWAITDLLDHWGKEPFEQVIGRYNYIRRIEHGDLRGVGDGSEGFFYANTNPTGLRDEYLGYLTGDLFAISPADTTFTGHWSWSWVMALYEMRFTTGKDANNYAPQMEVSRAEIATFLGRIMQYAGVDRNDTAIDFADVAPGTWYYDGVMLLRDYGITNGRGDNLYVPDDMVTRAEMAKLLQETFRVISVYSGGEWASQWWDTSFAAIPPHGLIFEDVEGTDWFAMYVEELFLDNLTDGCRREGLTLYYCPDRPVTRGEMAKFLMRAFQEDEYTKGFWPILAPEK